MKKILIKIGVFVAVFIVTSIVSNRFMNQNRDNMTTEMAAPSLPLVSMELEGISYNQLFGYTKPSDVAFQRDTITILGENRDADFTVNTYGANVTGIRVEVRSEDGSRLIENTELSDYQRSGMSIKGKLQLKDLLEKDTIYSLVIVLELDGEEEVRYYTKGIWSNSLYPIEKLQFVADFHHKLYDQAAARELTKYLESNSSLEDNRSFHKVNIHSSFRQITWDQLGVKEVSEPVLSLVDINKQTANILVDYVVSTSDDEKDTYYMVEERYQIRYTTDRMYLLDYERTMTQIPVGRYMAANDKLLLGISDTDIPKMESEDGNVLAFVVANRLYSYNVTENKLALIFSFYEDENRDVRALNDSHDIRILDIDEMGNVYYAVYGYMNRGQHEGEVGISVSFFHSAQNTVEELLYLPYGKPYAVLKAQAQQLLYLSQGQELYLSLDNRVYKINLLQKTYEVILDNAQEAGFMVSENHEIAMWQTDQLTVRNFETGTTHTLKAEAGERLFPLGFMEQDVIYGVGRNADIYTEKSGRKFLPMYKLCISDSQGTVLKEYQQDGIYITGIKAVDNHITLYRAKRGENGAYVAAFDDHIMNNNEDAQGKNQIVAPVIDKYKEFVQIKVHKAIDEKTFGVLTPKEVAHEGGRSITLPKNAEDKRFYVYGVNEVLDIFSKPADAVNLAYETSGVVTDSNGHVVWMKGNLVTKNQIMAIKQPEKVEAGKSLAKCLDVIAEFEGLVRPAESLLEQGKTALQIMTENFSDYTVLDMTGANLQSMLYYVNMDIPVLGLLNNGEAVAITGFNEQQVVIMEPATGGLYKMSKNEASKWFEANGNSFITYVR